MKEQMEPMIPLKALQRLPMYLQLLKEKRQKGQIYTASSALAAELGLTEIQVRKDLATVSKSGKPKVGYVIVDLIRDIEKALGYDNVHDAVLVGAGKLGRALMDYQGFKEYGLNIVAGFDIKATGLETEAGKPIYPMDKLEDLCKRLQIHMGIITVPADAAQEVCDQLVNAGIVAIWNFAPAHIWTPDDIYVKSENMASSLAVISNYLKVRMQD